MIKVERITIQEFRGIRNLTLELDGKNFAICGPNGTGKSGIVDALEFALTGNISRLMGKGRGALSIKAHGPHVDSRDNPERAMVTLDVVIPSLGNKKARIVRNVKTPTVPVITPSDPDVLAALKHVEQHPEFVLSRREIIKYVLAEPGERSKELQALLQLDELEMARTNLQKIANAAEKELRPLDLANTSATEALTRALGIAEATQESVLTAANEKRAVLSLPPLAKLEPTTSIRDGLESFLGAAPSRVPKVQARADLAIAKEAFAALSAPEFEKEKELAVAAIEKLKGDEESLKGMSRDEMLRSALELFDEKSCPVCETEWDPEGFKAVVNAQRVRLETVAKERRAAEALLVPIIRKVEAARAALHLLVPHGPLLLTPVDTVPLRDYNTYLSTATTQLRKFLPLDESLTALNLDADKAKPVPAILEALNVAVEAIPDPTDRDAAREFLILGQERLQTYRMAAARYKGAKKRAAVSKRVFEIYGEATTAALDSIYKQVEGEFREYYRQINNDDESTFEAQLTPSIGKLGFEVNFYDRGFFPPGAYHSEGHQDGMGLCLYLALMKHLLGEDGFTFAVLDDVLMSVDTGHRREVCNLLLSIFPKTQFVLTTHDGVWLRHMKTTTLIEPKAGIEFRKWHVDTGPAEWKDADVWAEIDGLVAKNEIRGAAALLRNHLEHLAAECCGRLHGRVAYQGDGRYELGDLMPSAIGAFRGLLKEAKAAANSWGNTALVTTIDEHDKAFAALAAAANVDQWQINPAVHYNEWANLERADFEPVVTAYKNLTAGFACPKCNGLLYVVPSRGPKDTLRCNCAALSFSLTPKK